jgi:transposase
MTQKAVDMNQIKQVQQLSQDGVSKKEIARRTGVSLKTVRKYLRKIEVVSPDSPAYPVVSMADKDLAAMVYNNDNTSVQGQRLAALMKHLEYAKGELHKPGVSKHVLWLEYIAENVGGYMRTQYCYRLRKYLKDTDPAFHWEYTPGEFIQVDFAGKKLCYVDKTAGGLVECEVFVAVLPFSGLIFCIAVASQKTADFAYCINEMVKYVGGVTKTILCDNFRTAVTRSDKYEPVFTELCYQLSGHYNTTFSATRPAKPTDKGMVEGTVNIVYSHIYARMRNSTFHSLEALNHELRLHLNTLNQKPYKNSRESRRDIFMRIEAVTLKPLPEAAYQVRKGKSVMVQRNYAIQLPDNEHYYTVPYEYVGCKVWVSYNSHTVEVYYQQERVAFHVRSSSEPKFNRIHEHMPENHKHMVDARGWTTEDLLKRAGWVGEYTRQAAEKIIHGSTYPEGNYKACNAMILLQGKYGKDRLEAACRRSANIPRPTLRLIKNILVAGLDKQPLLFEEIDKPLPDHDNIRGKQSYQ